MVIVSRGERRKVGKKVILDIENSKCDGMEYLCVCCDV